MNENAMNSTSETNWEKVDSLTEEEIDTSDIPHVQVFPYPHNMPYEEIEAVLKSNKIDGESL